MVYAYSEILFTNEMEWNSDTCYNRDEPPKYYSSLKSQLQKDKYYVIPCM